MRSFADRPLSIQLRSLLSAGMIDAAVAASDPMGCILAHTRGELSIAAWLRDSPLWPAIEKALKVDPKDRYPDAAAFVDALEEALDGGGTLWTRSMNWLQALSH